MSRLTRIIPSMYQRRLLLLGAFLALGVTPPVLQLARLSLVKGEEYTAEAEKRLVSQRWLPTVRGRVLDRKGRVLAVDRPSFDIAIDYSVITGQWAYQQAARKARRINGGAAGRWGEGSPEEREEMTAACRPEFDALLDAMWSRLGQLVGVSRTDLEQRRLDVRSQVEYLAATVAERQRRALEEKLNRGAEKFVDVKTSDVRRPIREERSPQTLLRDVPEAVGFELLRLVEADEDAAKADKAAIPLMPGLHVIDSGRRDYPLETMDVPVDLSTFPPPLRATVNGSRMVRVEGVATHALGWMRDKIEKEDVKARPLRKVDPATGKVTVDRGAYFANDSVGAAGVEAGFEGRLRGLRGLRTAHLDTDEEEVTPAAPGRDVRLTLDASLQARVQALFMPELGLTVVQPWHKSRNVVPAEGAPRELPQGTMLNGSVVVLDVQTGDVLAMVSAPSFPRGKLSTESDWVWKDTYATPHVNRAVGKLYMPGSIVKPLLLCAATTSGKYAPEERIACTGHFFPDKPLLYRCWIYKQHQTTHTDQYGHDLDGSEAIKVSCNIFFFEMGRRLGVDLITDWYRRIGVGVNAERWNLGSGGEITGSVPNVAKGNVYLNDAVLMGIGQGPVAWTPLHAADAYATLARGGVKVLPRLDSDAPPVATDLRFDRRAVGQALAGLKASAGEEHGTTYRVTYTMPDGEAISERIFDIPGVDVWAKSGTADVAPFIADLDFTGESGEGGAGETFDGDHAWCVFLVGVDDQPRYAVAVVVDHGGSGGRVSGPVGAQVVHALIAEGYLPKGEREAEPMTHAGGE